MCAVRNLFIGIADEDKILDHWEMCAVRNLAQAVIDGHAILDHWEMCAVRNRLKRDTSGSLDSRSLGDVRCPEHISTPYPEGGDSRSLGDVRCPEQIKPEHLAQMILDHWEMCAVRNDLLSHQRARHILDHWEMCSI